MSWLFDKIYGVDEEEQRARDVQAQIDALNAKQRAEGKISDDLWKEYEANKKRSGYDGLGGDDDFSDDIDQAFLDGLDEGADNIRGGVGATINTVVGTPLKLIPWQVWLAGLAYLGWRLGLFDGLLKGVLKKAKR